jgi:Uma2 family endonuclease
VHAKSIPSGRPIRGLKRSEYDQLVALGALRDEKVELLYGLIVRMSPQKFPHAFAIKRLTALLVPPLSGRADVCIQLPFAASDESEPEPDVAIVPVIDTARDHPHEAFLVIEVAESSLNDDRTTKRRLYAEAGVPEYWIVNLVDMQVEVHTKVEGGDYTVVTYHGPGETLRVPSFEDVTIAVSEVLPRP